MPRILVVEDQGLFGELMARALRLHDYDSVDVAVTSAAAIQLARSARPELALVEVHLRSEAKPEQAGLRLARFLLWGLGVPSLFVTAAPRHVRAGHDGCGVLEKPVLAQQLARAVGHALEMVRTGEVPHDLPDGLRLWAPAGGLRHTA